MVMISCIYALPFSKLFAYEIPDFQQPNSKGRNRHALNRFTIINGEISIICGPEPARYVGDEYEELLSSQWYSYNSTTTVKKKVYMPFDGDTSQTIILQIEQTGNRGDQIFASTHD